MTKVTRRPWTAVVMAGFVLAAAAAGREAVRLGTSTVRYLVFALVLAGVVAAYRRPAVGAYVLAALAPFEQYKQLGEMTVGSNEVLLLVLAPALLLGWRSTRAASQLLVTGAVLVALGAVLAVSQAIDVRVAIMGASLWMAFVAALVGGASLVRSGQLSPRRLSEAYLVGSAVSSVLGLLQSAGVYFVVGAPSTYVGDDVARVDSTFAYYSNFAAYEACAVIIGFGLILSRERPGAWRRILYLVSTILAGVSVVSSTSRGAVLATAVGCVALVVMQLTVDRALAIRGAFMLVAGAVLVPLLLASQVAALRARLVHRQYGDLIRANLQAAGKSIVETHPLGLGFGNFRLQLATTPDFGALPRLAHPHRLFLEVPIEIGWIGFLGFSLLLIATVARARGASLAGRANLIRAAAVAALLAFLVQGWNDYFFYETANLVGFLVVLLLATPPAARPSPVPAAVMAGHKS